MDKRNTTSQNSPEPGSVDSPEPGSVDSPEPGSVDSLEPGSVDSLEPGSVDSPEPGTLKNLEPRQSTVDSHDWVWQKLGAYLSAHDGKDTQPRRKIIEHFIHNNPQRHVSAEHVYEALKKQGHKLGLATVYRSLNLLVDADILEQHHFQNQKAVYELKHPDSHHDHLVCLDCGDIKEFEDAYIEKRQEDIASKLGFELASHRLELFGHCEKKNCPSKKST